MFWLMVIVVHWCSLPHVAIAAQKHHYQDIPDNVKRAIGGLPEGFLSYFTKRFPRLFLHVYGVVAVDPILRNDAMFRSYFDSGGD